MNSLRSILVLLFLPLFFTGCDKHPGKVLGEDEMVRLIADMEVAETYFQQHPVGNYNDSVRDRAVQYILDRHNISKEDFDSTLTWYGKNIDVYMDLYAKVDKELLKRQKKITGKSEAELSSNDLWPYSRHFFVEKKSDRKDIIFSIPGTDITPGERLIWRLRANSMPSGALLLGVEYENGASSISYQNTASKIPEITLQTDSSLKIKRVMGHFRIKEDLSDPIWIDSISLKSLPFDSTEYHKIYSQRVYHTPRRKIIKKEIPDTVKTEEENNKGIKANEMVSDLEPVRLLPQSEINNTGRPALGGVPEKLNRPIKISRKSK